MAHPKIGFSLDPLDTNLVISKPRQKVAEQKIAELEARGDLIATRKRDGYGGIATITGKKRIARLYTRGIADMSARFPHIIEALRDSAIPTDSLIPGEMFLRSRSADVDRLDLFGKLAKSNPERAIKLQAELGHAEFMAFTPLVAGERDIAGMSFGDRNSLLGEWFDKRGVATALTRMTPLQSSVAELRAQVVRENWEGLVLYDKSASTAYRLDGKGEDPPRPDGSWKWKPIFEDDFIVRKFEFGTGKNADRAGKLFLSQIDPVTGIEVACGETADLGTREEKLALARMVYPFVVQVQFEARTPKGACRISHLIRVRDDKGIAGCVLPEELHGLSKSQKQK